jgi:hypothetical protein
MRWGEGEGEGNLGSRWCLITVWSVSSEYQGDGIFEYRLTFSGQPYLERNGLAEFGLSRIQ